MVCVLFLPPLCCSLWHLPNKFHNQMKVSLAFVVAHPLKNLHAESSVCSRILYLQQRRPDFSPWVGKFPQRRKWIPTPVFLPGKSHGQRSLTGYIHRVAKSRTRLSDYTTTKGVSIILAVTANKY